MQSSDPEVVTMDAGDEVEVSKVALPEQVYGEEHV
jgi:hypothetical protein